MQQTYTSTRIHYSGSVISLRFSNLVSTVGFVSSNNIEFDYVYNYYDGLDTLDDDINEDNNIYSSYEDYCGQLYLANDDNNNNNNNNNNDNNNNNKFNNNNNEFSSIDAELLGLHPHQQSYKM